ncbi:MAG TPA: NTP transferase domain-containing protein [Acidimicrobiales bacterium]|nr:NTP transferase domain-containing protein [Acidimicrobiales bacterium]
MALDAGPNRRPLFAVVLAAGEGTRMRSTTPKPLHRLCGRPMVLHVLDALSELPVDRVVVVVGHGANEVVKTIQSDAPEDLLLEFVEQLEPRGTGDAVAVALTGFPDSFALDADEGDLVIVPGDTPLVRRATLAHLIREHRLRDAAATVLTAKLEDPFGYSRIVRSKDGRVSRIVDDADCSPSELDIDEVASQIYCFRRGVLAPALRRLSPDNSLGEYFLTDTIEVLHAAGYTVTTVIAGDAMEAAGVNDRAQLAAAESEVRARINERWMRRGVTMWDAESVFLDVTVQLGSDVTLMPGVVLEGSTTIGDGSLIGPDCHLVDCEVGEGVRLTHTVAERAVIEDHVVVGAFSVLEPGTRLARGERVGPFFGNPRAEERTS